MHFVCESVRKATTSAKFKVSKWGQDKQDRSSCQTAQVVIQGVLTRPTVSYSSGRATLIATFCQIVSQFVSKDTILQQLLSKKTGNLGKSSPESKLKEGLFAAIAVAAVLSERSQSKTCLVQQTYIQLNTKCLHRSELFTCSRMWVINCTNPMFMMERKAEVI